MKKKKGFTLVELMVVIAITAVFGAIVLMISTTSGKLFSMTQRDSYINDEARLALSVLEEDLRIGKNVDHSIDYLSGDDEITIGGVTVSNCKDIGLPEGQFKILLKANIRGELYYYIHYANKLEKMKLEVGRFKTINTISNVKEGGISKNLSDPTDKRYFVGFRFEDSRGDTTVYSTVVMPRN